jgi:energy-coupling factor transporter transmembrane protein EcfT
MKAPTPSVPVPAKPSWRIRLTSWKWWVYGDAYSQPLDKLPKRFYLQVAVAATLWVVIAFHPWMTTFINREPPPFEQLKVVEGTIHTTYEKNPHVIFKTRDGRNLEMEFPVFLNTLGKQTPRASIRNLGKFNRNLVGCEGRIWYDVPVGTLWTRYRIWQVECPNLGLSVPYEDASRSDLHLGFAAIFVFFLMPLGFSSIFFRMSRGNYR